MNLRWIQLILGDLPRQGEPDGPVLFPLDPIEFTLSLPLPLLAFTVGLRVQGLDIHHAGLGIPKHLRALVPDQPLQTSLPGS